MGRTNATNATNEGTTMTTTTTKTSITRDRMNPGRFDVILGGVYRGYLLKDATSGVWSAYRAGEWTRDGQAPAILVGYAKVRKACVALLAA